MNVCERCGKPVYHLVMIAGDKVCTDCEHELWHGVMIQYV